MYDLIIIGGSAAGISAAIYAARRNLKFMIIAKEIGGEVALSGEINNWPGIISIDGLELAKKFQEHIKFYNAEIREGFLVTKITQEKNFHIISTDKGETFEAKAVLIATGIHPRSLNLPNDQELRGKGLTYCTVCDGPLFKGKVTATIGAGNSALESALMMGSGIAKKTYLLTKFPNDQKNNWGFPRGENILIDKVKELKNVEIIYNANTTEIIGDPFVKKLKYTDTKENKQKELDVDGVMVHIGMLPNSEFADVAKDEAKQIIINEKCKTNIAGIFAAGDVTNIPYKQIAIATGQGVVAALSAIEYVNRWKKND